MAHGKEAKIDSETEGTKQKRMTSVSGSARSTLHFVNDPADIRKVFVDEIESLLAPVAREVQLEIEFEDQVLIDTPAWIAHFIVPLAFALISYRFACLALGRLSAGKDSA